VVRLHINCDVGESDVNQSAQPFEKLAPFISSANVACGFHAGNPRLISEIIDSCLENGIEIGAHPSFRDRINFGRVIIKTEPSELYFDVLYQLGALNQVIKAKGARLNHIKPHGALYNATAVDRKISEEMFQAISDFDSHIKVYGLPGSLHEESAKFFGIEFIPEGFADRRYDTVAKLLNREKMNSVFVDPNQVVEQVGLLLNDRVVTYSEGAQALKIMTVCIHGDNPNVLEILKELAQNFDIVKSTNV
jgi:UPF0271 protein